MRGKQAEEAPVMYIVTGVSFSGKSVLSRAIRDAKSIPVIDPDEVGRESGLGLQGEFLSPEQWGVIHTEAKR